jgi:hypothetical protein
VGDPIPAIWAEHVDGRVAVPLNDPRLDTPVTLQLVHLEQVDGVVLDEVGDGPMCRAAKKAAEEVRRESEGAAGRYCAVVEREAERARAAEREEVSGGSDEEE